MARVLDKTNTSKFQSVIDAVRLREQGVIAANDALWTIGDALIATCGPPGPNGENDRSHKLMGDIAGELAGLGFKGYRLVTLRLLRRVAASFAPDKRLTGVSWSHHMLAGDRRTLDDARQHAEQKGVANFTVDFIRTFIKRRNRGSHNVGAAQRALDVALARGADFLDALKRLVPYQPDLTDDDLEPLHELLDRVNGTKLRPQFREAAE
jgi:hypothetical protein